MAKAALLRGGGGEGVKNGSTYFMYDLRCHCKLGRNDYQRKRSKQSEPGPHAGEKV